MKNIIKSLVIVVAVAAVAGMATYSYFSDSVVVSDITLSSGNADLKISDNASSGFQDNVDASSFAMNEVYPGQDLLPGGYNFYLKNESDSAIGLDTYFKLQTTSGDYALCDAVDLKLKKMGMGGYETDWHSLCWWRDNFTGNGWRMMNTTGEPEVIPQNGVHGWTAYAKVDENAGNEIQGQTLGLNITFFAEQHH